MGRADEDEKIAHMQKIIELLSRLIALLDEQNALLRGQREREATKMPSGGCFP